MTAYDPTEYRQYFEREVSYIAGFWRNTHRYAGKPAIFDHDTGTDLSYAELGERVRKLATGLVDAGVQRGDIVVYQLFNSLEFALVYLATQTCGAIGAPINYRLAPGEIAYVLDDSTPRLFIFDSTLHETAAEALDQAGHRPALIASTDHGHLCSGVVPFSSLFADRGRDLPGPQSVYDETTRLYTSGTTGMPKGVPLNSLVELFTAHDVIMHLPLSPEDRTLNMTPWFHRGGVHIGPSPAFYAGASVVPIRAFDADLCLDLVEEQGLTYLVGSPTNLAMLTEAQSRNPRDLDSLRGIVTMGSPLEREACLKYQEILTPRIFNGYGTTEAFWNTFLRPADLPEYAGSAGRACTDDDVAVVRVYEDKLAAPDDFAATDGSEVGEVIVRSPKSAQSYANAPEQEAARFHDGWLYIGDLATWDENEYVTIVGRKDDMIISGGENVHPVQVEEVLNEHPGIQDALVVSVPDSTWGERVVAFIVPDEESLTATDCDRHCRDHSGLADFKRPRAYRFVDSLPLTATGKKVHYRAREQAIEEFDQGLFELVDSA